MAKNKISSKNNDRSDKNNNIDEQKLDDTKYYEKLYDGLPKELTNILIETHPFKGKNLDSEEAAYRTRTRTVEEIDEIKKARSKQIKEELKKDLEAKHKENIDEELDMTNPFSDKINLKKSINEKLDIKNKSRNEKKNKDLEVMKNNNNVVIEKKENKNNSKKINNKIVNNEYDIIQPVQFKASKNNYSNEKNFDKKFNLEQKKNNNYNIDYEKLTQKASVSDLYNNQDFEDDEEIIKLPSNKKIIYGIGSIFIILFLFFALRSFILSNKLDKVEKEIANFEGIQEKNEELKLDNLSLQEEISKNKESDTIQQDMIQQQENMNNEEFETYTVVEGDTLGSIATKVYGNYAYYTKILEANGITEDVRLQIGQVLKIPKITN